MSGPQASPPASSPAGPPTPRAPGTVKIGTIAGSDVLVTSSWFLVAGLIAIVMAPHAEAVHPGLGPWKYVAGFAFAVVLYLSVLLHEASHAYMARHYGFPVSTITLHFLGGVTAIEAEAKKPRQEFWIAVVGPLTSIAVGLVALGLRSVVPDGLLLMVVEGLAFGNLFIGALNLVPGLPLDGGRVLKSAVWQLTGSLHRGTVVAAWGGRVTAVAVLLWPLAQQAIWGTEPDVFDFVLAFIIGFFLWNGATASLQAAKIRRRLPVLVARNLARRTLQAPEDLPLAEAVRRARASTAEPSA
ncbi:MAG TPA: site-2 protease family protein, partial [Nocardioides bacterium]|nr:site-2 protease family protein [Nocardioides sp.]